MMKDVKKDRPAIALGQTTSVETGCGKLFVTINLDEDGKAFEVFTRIGKSGGCAAAQCESTGRLISLYLRTGGDIKRIVRQLKGIVCHNKKGMGPNSVFSCSDGIAKCIEEISGISIKSSTTTIINEENDIPTSTEKKIEEKHDTKDSHSNHAGACSECGSSNFHMSEGCMTCHDCGYSKCS